MQYPQPSTCWCGNRALWVNREHKVAMCSLHAPLEAIRCVLTPIEAARKDAA